MRTRPDASQETLARRLALLRALPPDEDAEGPEASFVEDEDAAEWWGPHTSVPHEPAPTVVEPVAVPVVEPVAVPLAVPVPVPGRHASRRAPAATARRPVLPAALGGRVRLGPAQLAVVALVLVAALALTCWWLARGRATALSDPAVAAPSSAAPLVGLASPAAAPVVEAGTATDTTSPRTPPGTVASASATAEATVTVDVEGKVRRPGIVILPTGSRVTDALKAAGGVPHRRALHGLNLAAVLTDGQQIMVGAAAPPTDGGLPAAPTGGGAGSTTGPATQVNLNTATAEQLDALPDIGPVTAQSILEWREENGRFTSVQELLDVDGIGPATLAKLTPHVTV